MIPIVRWETPYLAYMQERIRTPTLDSYFAYTANLGTHTFFMIFLPILYWCGYSNMGRAYVRLQFFFDLHVRQRLTAMSAEWFTCWRAASLPAAS